MKTVLFSAIGGTDPITNQSDGAMLHICRVKRPDKVYLYFSKEMMEYEQKDHRYTRVIELLNQSEECRIETECFFDPEMVDVHIFDAFIEKFESYIKLILEQEGEDTEILMNVSSGTPAMKSSLQLLSFMYPKYRAVQVSTPARKMNTVREDHNNYDVDVQWELDEDNVPGFVDRTSLSSAFRLRDRITKQSICKFLDNYDYPAAKLMTAELFDAPDESFSLLLDMANKREQIDIRSIRGAFSKFPDEIFPIRKDGEIEDFECMLSLISKWKRGFYADFIRGITPLTTELIEKTMISSCGVTLDMIGRKNQKGIYCLDELVLDRHPDVKQALLNQFGLDMRYRTPLGTAQYAAIIKGLSTDQKLVDLVDDIRKIETNVRNFAAHQIVSITDRFVKDNTGHTMKEIVDTLKKLFSYSGINVRKEYWDTYDRMNDYLKELLMKE